MATTVVACLPDGVLQQILDIWEDRSNRRMILDFKHGRCLKSEVIKTQRYTNDDFNQGADNDAVR